jgi:glycosyltransferase involved in cell wall biosynthesis
MPKVSVIIPTHNRADLLGAAITSVLKQTYQDFEIIVVDDASTDHTPEIIAAFDNEKVRYIRHEVNKGDAGSRNTGILNSRGDYLALLDDDDEWLPEKLQMQVDALTHSSSKVGGVYTGKLSIDRATGKILGVYSPERGVDSFEEIFAVNFINTSSILLKRECIEKVGLFDERMPCSSDFDMWIRIGEHFHFEYIKEPLVIYHVHDQKLSTNLALVLQGLEMVLEKYDKCFLSNKRNYSLLHYNLGLIYCLNGNSEKSKKAFFKAIESRPLGIKYYPALVISLLGSRVLQQSIVIKEKITAPLRKRKISQELQRVATSSLIPTVRSICRSGVL